MLNWIVWYWTVFVIETILTRTVLDCFRTVFDIETVLILKWIVWIWTVWLNWIAWNRNVFNN